MDSVLTVNPGLIFWTLVNFGLFLLILVKFGWKPMMQALKNREETITNSVAGAEKANAEAQALLAESRQKMSQAAQEMTEIVRQGKLQAEAQLQKATSEADKIRKQKVDEAVRQIEQQKQDALASLRTEVANLVVDTTEKVLRTTIDQAKHRELAEQFIADIKNN